MDRRTADVQQILDSFRRIIRVLRESSRAAEQRVGVTGAQLFVLQTLARRPSLSLNELAEHTHTHQSTVSVVVSKLVEAGLVHREPSGKDARRLQLALSSEGRALLRRAPGAAQERLIEAIEGLAVLERGGLATLLGRLVETMDVADQEPGMLFDDPSPPVRVGRAARARRSG
jgi:DNA-binding MarR family transcriptional regulator